MASSIGMLVAFRVIRASWWSADARRHDDPHQGRRPLNASVSVAGRLGSPMPLGPTAEPDLRWAAREASWHWVFLINVPVGIVAFV